MCRPRKLQMRIATSRRRTNSKFKFGISPLGTDTPQTTVALTLERDKKFFYHSGYIGVVVELYGVHYPIDYQRYRMARSIVHGEDE